MKRRALEGVRVLDLSRVLAGPYAAQILGDLGADVIKIEHPAGGDETRRWGPPFWQDSAVYYLTANRNKRSRAIDFATAAGSAELHSLLEDADVLIENSKAGALAKYGLDYASLRQRYPRLIHCSITGFGQSGPYAAAAGYDALVQAMGGLMSITGPDAESPTKVGVAITDLMTGLYATIAILAALRAREESGTGQHCDVSLFDTQVSSLANVAMAYLVTGSVPRPLGNAHPTIVPYQSFATRDRPILIAIGSDAQFLSFAERLGAPGVGEDPRFRTNPLRVENREELVSRIAARLLTAERDEWLARFAGGGFPCGPINDLGDLGADPHVRARGLFTRMDDGETPCLRSPLRLSETPVEEYRRPPRLGEHPDARFVPSPRSEPPKSSD